MGYFLFLIFINDIVTDIGSNIRLFADDTSLYIIVDHPDLAVRCINCDLDTISDWADKRLNVMRILKIILDRKSLEIIYTSFIRPLLEYGDTLWDNCTLYEKRELDKIQNETARIATGATALVSIQALYDEVGWEHCKQGERIISCLYFSKCNTTLLQLT